MTELHRKCTAALGNGSQRGGIPEHLGKGHLRCQVLHQPFGCDLFYLAQSRVQVTDDVSHEFLGNQNVGLHDWLQEDRIGLLEGISKSH
jgi:hypothetical protein